MTVEQYNAVYNLLSAISETLKEVLKVQQTLAKGMAAARNGSGAPDAAPNYHKPLADYTSFDWSKIGAIVLESDKDGATTVEWKNRSFTRRRGNPDFDPVIYFSRSTGVDSVTGKRVYEWLITFKEPAKAKRLPDDTKDAMAEAAARKQQQQPSQPVTTPPTEKGDSPSVSGSVSSKFPEPVCSEVSWAKLQAAADDAATFGVTPEKWKAKVKSAIGSDNMRAMDDAEIAKAVNIILGLTQTAKLAASNRI